MSINTKLVLALKPYAENTFVSIFQKIKSQYCCSKKNPQKHVLIEKKQSIRLNDVNEATNLFANFKINILP